MGRKLSLSQSARLIGVSRKDIQQKVLQGELVVMEGTVLLEDLKKVFPDAQYEDNTVIERMQKIMSDAVHKMAQSEREGAQLDALSKRAYLLNQELSQQKARADFYEELINKLKHKFVNISSNQVDKSQIIQLQKWLLEETKDESGTINQSSNQNIEDQIEQFMSPHVRLLPSRHDYFSDKCETLLESALHAGLAVNYGCNNGKCGKCKVKLLSGQVEKTRDSDYIMSDELKSQNYILSCSNRAVTDVVLETKEAVSAEDIPLQKIETKIKNLNFVNNLVYILNLKTPQSQRLRFIAGQDLKLTLYDEGQPISTKLTIASCPCDDMNLQFHIPNDPSDPFLQHLPKTHQQDKYIIIEGPEGDFTLDENSPRALTFIAWETGFASIISIIEHALALDMAEHIHLYWVVSKEENLYMKNICRSWNDALDNFFFHPIVTKHPNIKVCNQLIEQIQEHSDIEELDFYIGASQDIVECFSSQLTDLGCTEDQIYAK